MNHELLEKRLNTKAKEILNLIKKDYYYKFSEEKKKTMDELLMAEKVVIVNHGKSQTGDNTLAHGGRALKDGKIHFYPDVRNFKTDEAAFDKCSGLLPHELFHYFLQPDNIKLEANLEKEMASFYTEGLIEKETRKFCRKHPKINFEKAYYGYNINFVNMIQASLGADKYEVMFSESDYLKDIGKYSSQYETVIQAKSRNLTDIARMLGKFPKYFQEKYKDRVKTMILRDGNSKAAREKLESLEYLQKAEIVEDTER